jgi:hypothetical protein
MKDLLKELTLFSLEAPRKEKNLSTSVELQVFPDHTLNHILDPTEENSKELLVYHDNADKISEKNYC